MRFWRRHRSLSASLAVLGLIALACLVGPMVAPHPYDRVYRDYVLAAPALGLHPSQPEAEAAMADIGRRLDLKTATAPEGDGMMSVTFESPHGVDPRALRFIDRSDLFAPPTDVVASDAGRHLAFRVPLKRNRFLLGTDANGRDLLTRTLVAGRISLAVGVLASAVALVIGVGWGTVAGYAGGRIDALMMRLVDIFYALPFIFFVIVLVVFFGRNFLLIFVAIGAVEWLDMARIVRGQTLSLKRRDFVAAAEALGATTPAILRRHIVPNLVGPIVAYLSLLVPRVILAESFVSFLGLGVQEPLTSWGILIADGARNVQGSLHLLIFPALILAATLLAFNALGESVRAIFEPA